MEWLFVVLDFCVKVKKKKKKKAGPVFMFVGTHEKKKKNGDEPLPYTDSEGK